MQWSFIILPGLHPPQRSFSWDLPMSAIFHWFNLQFFHPTLTFVLITRNLPIDVVVIKGVGIICISMVAYLRAIKHSQSALDSNSPNGLRHISQSHRCCKGDQFSFMHHRHLGLLTLGNYSPKRIFSEPSGSQKAYENQPILWLRN